MTTIDANYQEWRFGRTNDYPDGPWKAEPDKIQWIDSATDLDCLIVRNGGGALCGYVGVPPQHPWHGKDYSECVGVCLTKPDDYCYSHSPDAYMRVHGGLTFAARCAENREEGICHVPAPGRPHDVWWFGFDCAHVGDQIPRHERWGGSIFGDEVYRDVAYVRSEIASLAQQLSDVARSAEL